MDKIEVQLLLLIFIKSGAFNRNYFVMRSQIPKTFLSAYVIRIMWHQQAYIEIHINQY